MDGALVLLVDDEETIVDVLKETLEDGGFEVVTATSGEAAIRAIREASEVAALVTDVRLGAGPNGWDVAHVARECFKDVAIVYISGDSAHDWMSKGVPKSICIQKPFAPAQVVTAVATLLNKIDSA